MSRKVYCIREILNNFGEFWGTLGSFGELFFGELQKSWGTFPKFPKVPLGPPPIGWEVNGLFLLGAHVLSLAKNVLNNSRTWQG